MRYSLWIEAELFENPSEEEDYCNVSVTFEDGRTEGFNVWTTDFFRNELGRIFAEADEEGYANLPDFIVTKLDRAHLTEVLKKEIGPSE